MKIVLIMNQNSYVGREYMSRMNSYGFDYDVITIGTYPEINPLEEERCNGLWQPIEFNKLVRHHSVFHFASLKDDLLQEFLEEQKYDIAIQGGTGILRKNIIAAFGLGILNFHPGDLPTYRGCSAPEWQVFEGGPVVCTCHLIDEGIDTGPIYKKKELNLDYTDYYTMRSTVYPQITEFVAETIKELRESEDIGAGCEFHQQDERKANYREYIGQEKIEILKSQWQEFVIVL